MGQERGHSPYLAPPPAPSGTAPALAGLTGPIGANGNITLPWPTGHTAGDVALVIAVARADKTVEVPGWTVALDLNGGADDRDRRLLIAWRRASGGSEAPAEVQRGGNVCLAALLLIRGCAATGSPIGAVASDAVLHTDRSATVTTPALAAVAADHLVMGMVAAADVTGLAGALTNGDLAEVAMAVSDTTPAAAGAGLHVALGQTGADGPVGPFIGTLVAEVTQARATLTLRPE